MKLSIVTVCLNSVETVEDTIKSVLIQDYKDIEYIIVDGGSTDGTIDVIEKYRERMSRFVSEPDKGIYDAMNKGLGLCTGEAVGFLNAGDFYAGEFVISRVAALMSETNVEAVYGDLEYVASNEPGKRIRRWKSQAYRNGLFEKGWHPPHPAFFVKRQVFEKYGYFNPKFKIAADYELMLRFLRKYGVSSCYIPAVLVKMRIGGKSNKNLSQIIRANIECYKAWGENGLKVGAFTILRKPMSKLKQYL